MKFWFSSRGQPKDVIETKINFKCTWKVKNTKRAKPMKGVSFVMTYHHNLVSSPQEVGVGKSFWAQGVDCFFTDFSGGRRQCGYFIILRQVGRDDVLLIMVSHLERYNHSNIDGLGRPSICPWMLNDVLTLPTYCILHKEHSIRYIRLLL